MANDFFDAAEEMLNLVLDVVNPDSNTTKNNVTLTRKPDTNKNTL